MPITVIAYQDEWPRQFEEVASRLRAVLGNLTSAVVEHVGSTSVPGLVAKPILDIDVIVDEHELAAAVSAVESLGYVHRGDLGVEGREAFFAPDDNPLRHVYVCRRDALSVRNHLAVRDVLRRRRDLRDSYGEIKLRLSADPQVEIDAYIAGKSAVLRRVLIAADAFTAEEIDAIFALNTTPPNDSESQVGTGRWSGST